MTRLSSSAWGRQVALHVPDADIAAVRELLPFWWADDDAMPERTWSATADDAVTVIRELELWVAEHAVGAVFVHAGVVAIDGRAVLLPGRSMAGKTTLVAALLRAGAQYLSDEYAVLMRAGDRAVVHAYPRPLSLRGGGPQRLRTPASEFSAVTVTAPLRVGTVAHLRFEPGGEWSVEPMSAAEAVLVLLDNTVSAQRDPEAALDAAAKVATDARCLRGTRGDADAAASEMIRAR